MPNCERDPLERWQLELLVVYNSAYAMSPPEPGLPTEHVTTAVLQFYPELFLCIYACESQVVSAADRYADDDVAKRVDILHMKSKSVVSDILVYEDLVGRVVCPEEVVGDTFVYDELEGREGLMIEG